MHKTKHFEWAIALLKHRWRYNHKLIFTPPAFNISERIHFLLQTLHEICSLCCLWSKAQEKLTSFPFYFLKTMKFNLSINKRYRMTYCYSYWDIPAKCKPKYILFIKMILSAYLKFIEVVNWILHRLLAILFLSKTW